MEITTYKNEDGDSVMVARLKAGDPRVRGLLHCNCPHIENGACGACAGRASLFFFETALRLGGQGMRPEND